MAICLAPGDGTGSGEECEPGRYGSTRSNPKLSFAFGPSRARPGAFPASAGSISGRRPACARRPEVGSVDSSQSSLSGPCRTPLDSRPATNRVPKRGWRRCIMKPTPECPADSHRRRNARRTLTAAGMPGGLSPPPECPADSHRRRARGSSLAAAVVVGTSYILTETAPLECTAHRNRHPRGWPCRRRSNRAAGLSSSAPSRAALR
jgi:hypothetical protein